MENLLEETARVLGKNGVSTADVRWIGRPDRGATMSWDAFAAIADREYDEGLGGTEVRDDLLVVGDDWWLERHEYDGSEWWEFKRMPSPPAEAPPLSGKDVWGSSWED